MSADKFADSQKKLELATNIVVACINASKPASSEKSSKDKEKEDKENSPVNEKQVLSLLENTFAKMNELVPFQERKIGLGK